MSLSVTSKQSHGVPAFTWKHSQPTRSRSGLQRRDTKALEASELQAKLEGSQTWKTDYIAVDDMDDDSDEEDYQPIRRELVRIFQMKRAELLLASVIFLNLCFLVVETDYDAIDEDSPGWIKFANLVLIFFYSAELCLRIFAFRMVFFKSKANVFDFLVVLTDLLFLLIDAFGDVDLPRLAYLRMFRILRMGRTMKVLVMFPELTRMVNSLMSGVKKVMWGGLLLVFILLLWALLSVQIIHPLNRKLAEAGHYEGSCTRCPHAYESVFQACVTIFQNLVAGDSWGSVNVVIIDEYPWSLAFFAAMLGSLSVIMLNLVTAMIVDGAQDARQQEDHTLAQLKDQQYADATVRLRALCETIDADGSGTLTHEELRKGFETNQDFQDTLKILDIAYSDIDVLFEILDTDKSGDIDYGEFIEQMRRMRCDDLHTLVVFIKYYVMEVHTKVNEHIDLIKDQLFSPPGNLSCKPPLKSVPAIPTTPRNGCSDANDGVSKLMLTQLLNHMTSGFSDQQKEFKAVCNVFSHLSDTALSPGSNSTLAGFRSPSSARDHKTIEAWDRRMFQDTYSEDVIP